jgi:hypothetical protein
MKQIITIQRFEGLAVAIASTVFFIDQGFAWYWLLVIFLVFDISMIGYAHHEKTGALTYNLVHNYALPLVLVLLSVSQDWSTGVFIGLTWMFHVGVDRAFGYGLKKNSFKDTHLKEL